MLICELWRARGFAANAATAATAAAAIATGEHHLAGAGAAAAADGPESACGLRRSRDGSSRPAATAGIVGRCSERFEQLPAHAWRSLAAVRGPR